MVRTITAALVTSFLISSCVSEPASEGGELYRSYKEYRGTVSRHNIWSTHHDFFSELLVKPELRNEPQVEDQLLFAAYMQKETDHLEAITDEGGCLVVTGVDSDGQPLAFELSYVEEGGAWLMSRIVVHAADKVDELPREADCSN